MPKINSSLKLSEWENHFTAQIRSGLSQVAYCRQHGLSDKSFGYWLRKSRDAAVTVEKPVLFADLKPRPMPVRIQFSGGVTIECDSGTNPQWLGSVISGVLHS